MQHAAAFRPDVDAFATTVRRPGCRIEHPLDPNSLGYVPWLTKLTPLNHLLGASANAAAALGDDPELTRSIETLLQAGRHLRGSNLALGVVVGCGFECTAYDVLNNLPAPENWPESARLKWVAALDLRTRTPADEFAAVCRVERGKFLKFLEGVESTPTLPMGPGLYRYGPFRRTFLARAKLSGCEARKKWCSPRTANC
jgi:hypothetical protein